VSTLASIASVSGGVTAAGALAGVSESVGTRVLDDGAAVAVAAGPLPEAANGASSGAAADHGDGASVPDEIVDGPVSSV